MEIDNKHAVLTFLEGGVIVIDTKEGETLTLGIAKELFEVIEQQVPDEYSLIINRRENSKLMRCEIYRKMGARERLRGLALVTTRTVTGPMSGLEASLCQKPFHNFNNVDDAIRWARQILEPARNVQVR